MPTKDDLKVLQALDLEMKILKTLLRIREFVDRYGENDVYISFSGGKDSTVLLHIVRKEFPNIKAVFADTGLEYPEIREFVKTFDNVVIVRPKMIFSEVIKKYGYPIISKNVSHNVKIAKYNPNGNVMLNCFDKNKKGQYAMYKWTTLLNAPFDISEKCCNEMKKKPFKSNFKSEMSIVGTTANESKFRKEKWLKYGCNLFDTKNPQSAPLSFWTENDILTYIKQNNLPIASVYGDVVSVDKDGFEMDTNLFDTCKYKTTGCERTGCVFCGFGAHLEKGKGRFERLKQTHPKQYNYCINGGEFDPVDGLWKPNKQGLGMGFVFDWCNKNINNFKIKY